MKKPIRKCVLCEREALAKSEFCGVHTTSPAWSAVRDILSKEPHIPIREFIRRLEERSA